MLDQRGTGLSYPITEQSFSKITDENLAHHLTFFRADNIVKDAEFIRKQIIGNEKWSILGQSFGGFCAANYLSYYPCLLYTSPSPRDVEESRMPSSA